MTVARRSEPLRFRDLGEVMAAVRRDGGRLTTPRRQVLEALFAADAPVSAEQIAGTAIDLTSVYRNLERLEELGVVRHVHFGHGPSLYALVGQGEREYLVCEACGAVTAVEPARLDAARAAIRAELGYEARFTHFAVHGLCGACAAGDRADI
jgi:Fur family ferric uptake transcriptional regulator